MITPFKAYKGFDKNLKCKDHQFVIGEVATKPEVEKPRLCSADGFHYCVKLDDVYEYYALNSSHRFCEIEVLGNFTDDGKKGVTTSLKVVRELTTTELYEQRIEDNMQLENVRKLQTQYPLVHIGGSIGLFLHGVRLKRWQHSQTDMDIVVPYFTLFDSFGDEDLEYINGKKSSNDFDQNFVLNSVKVDCRVDPKQRYEIIEYKGFKYKVSAFETIMEAKMRYAVNGQSKHIEDIREMCGVKSKS